MGKLYPPTIPGTIPAFYGTSIEVPFSMNRAVGLSEFNGFALKIKKVSGTLVGTVFEDYATAWVEAGAVKFKIPERIAQELVQGQFYKVQLAYMKKSGDTRTIGIYSTIGIVKYTTMPIVRIENMNENVVNNHSYSYTGVYQQLLETKDANGIVSIDWASQDTTEKLYSSRFLITDTKGNIIKDSGEILHNTTYDTSAYESSESYVISEDLELNQIYYLYYIATTVNGLVKESPRYRITQRRQIPMSLEADIKASLNYESGTIDIHLIGHHLNQIASGLFLLSRRVKSAENDWEELYYFSLQSEIPDRLLFTDYTVAQGVEYVYSLQQYNTSDVYSDRIFSNSIVADFEDLFLYDGERQLKVKFNPKVSTFKPNVIETKTNTLGSKHPFIVRNGKVDYKEFAISGLISYQMDDVELFLSKGDLGLEYATHNLITENIKAERDFKLAVLEWLNNGQPKLFRSPTEGNYIVRLMNVTMSPTDTLGRMLHTFSCSAYEIDNYSYENLHKHGLISVINNVKYQMRWATIELSSPNALVNNEIHYYTGQINIGNGYGEETVRPVYHISATEMTPGTYFLVGDSLENAQRIYIGSTGSYEIHVDEPYNYVGIPVKDDFGHPVTWSGLITYGYKSQVTSLFDLISKVEINDIPCHRIMGDTGEGVLSSLEDIKTTILAIRYVSFHLREYYPIYVKRSDFDPADRSTWEFYTDSNNYYYYQDILEYPERASMYSDVPVDLKQLAPWNLYKICYKRFNNSYRGPDFIYGTVDDERNPTGDGYYVDKGGLDQNGELFNPPVTSEYGSELYYDPLTDKIYTDDGFLFSVNVNGEVVDLSQTEELFISGIENYDILKAGAGIITDIGYQTQTSTYSFETTNFEIAELKRTYEVELNKYLAARGINNSVNSDVAKHAYSTFIGRLTEIVERYKEENSID